MYLQIDERTDTLTSLSLCLKCCNLTEDDPAMWKWAILSLHSALQGAMVCHLSGTANLGALSDKSAKAWLAWYERDRRGEIKRINVGFDELGIPKTKFASKADEPPPERLAEAKTLFERLQDDAKRCELGAGAVLEITDRQQKSFELLHSFRNDFTHFTPKGWSIELSGLPDIFLDIVEVLEKISSDRWPFRHMEEQERVQLNSLIRQLKGELESMLAKDMLAKE